MVVEKSNSIQVIQQCLRCYYTNIELKIPIFFGYVLNFPRVSNLANFTIGLIENQMGHLLECVELYGKLINKSEI